MTYASAHLRIVSVSGRLRSGFRLTTTIEAQVSEPGEIVLSAKLFGEIVRRLPGDQVRLSCDEKYNTLITSGQAEFTIIGLSATEYPEIPTVPDGAAFTLPQNLLRSMIRQTILPWHKPTPAPFTPAYSLKSQRTACV